MKLLGGNWVLVVIACHIVFLRTLIPIEILKFSDTLAIVFFLAYSFIFFHKTHKEAGENKLRPVSEMTGELLSKEVHEKTRQLLRKEAGKARFYKKRLSEMFNFIALYKDRASEVNNFKEQAMENAQKAQDILMMWSRTTIPPYQLNPK